MGTFPTNGYAPDLEALLPTADSGELHPHDIPDALSRNRSHRKPPSVERVRREFLPPLRTFSSLYRHLTASARSPGASSPAAIRTGEERYRISDIAGRLSIAAQLLFEEIANIVERLLRSLQKREVGGENVHHPRPSVEVSRSAFVFQALGVTNGIVKKNIVYADMHLTSRGEASPCRGSRGSCPAR